MAVSKQQKVEILEKLVENIKGAASIGFTQTNGVTVAEFDELRGELRKVGTSYTIAKKTLIRKAIKDALDIDIDIKNLPGQVGIICSREDAIAGLSKTNDFVKKHAKQEKLLWVASIFEGAFKDLEETKVIASMPSKETLLSRLVGSMKSPISALARFMDAAAKEVEAQGKTTVGELDFSSDTPSEEKKETPAKDEAPKAEEEKEEKTVTEVKQETSEKSSEAPAKDEEKKETPAE